MWGFQKPLFRPQPAWAQRMEKRIMAKIDDQLKTLSDAFGAVSTGIDGITTEVGAIHGDITNLQDQVTTLQQNVTGLSPAQQTIMDTLVTTAQSVVDKTTALAATVKAVDDMVPDTVAAAPADGAATGDAGGKS